MKYPCSSQPNMKENGLVFLRSDLFFSCTNFTVLHSASTAAYYRRPFCIRYCLNVSLLLVKSVILSTTISITRWRELVRTKIQTTHPSLSWDIILIMSSDIITDINQTHHIQLFRHRDVCDIQGKRTIWIRAAYHGPNTIVNP